MYDKGDFSTLAISLDRLRLCCYAVFILTLAMCQFLTVRSSVTHVVSLCSAYSSSLARHGSR